MCGNADRLMCGITAAGAIFIGENTPEPVGDFTAGPSHVLPTGGSARFFGGLTVETLFRRSSILKYTRQALAKELPEILEFSRMEGLDAHGRSAAARFERKKNWFVKRPPHEKPRLGKPRHPLGSSAE